MSIILFLVTRILLLLSKVMGVLSKLESLLEQTLKNKLLKIHKQYRNNHNN